MQRSLERFQISPEEYFSDQDQAFADIRANFASLSRRTDELLALCEEIARTRLTAPATAPVPSRWSYDVRLPNYLFDDVFEPEAVPGGAKRWVGTGCRIAMTLQLPRNVQYDVAIQIEDFVSDAAAKSFYLRVGGLQYPWLSHEGKRYASFVLADDHADALALEIGVDTASISLDRDVSFSFRSIDVVRRQ